MIFSAELFQLLYSYISNILSLTNPKLNIVLVEPYTISDIQLFFTWRNCNFIQFDIMNFITGITQFQN